MDSAVATATVGSGIHFHRDISCCKICPFSSILLAVAAYSTRSLHGNQVVFNLSVRRKKSLLTFTFWGKNCTSPIEETAIMAQSYSNFYFFVGIKGDSQRHRP